MWNTRKKKSLQDFYNEVWFMGIFSKKHNTHKKALEHVLQRQQGVFNMARENAGNFSQFDVYGIRYETYEYLSKVLEHSVCTRGKRSKI